MILILKFSQSVNVPLFKVSYFFKKKKKRKKKYREDNVTEAQKAQGDDACASVEGVSLIDTACLMAL